MAQGARIHGNLFYDNEYADLFMEVDHGPFIVDNNIFLSKASQRVNSQGGAYIHNLFSGGVSFVSSDDRMTPFMKPHSTEIAGLKNNPSGDMRFYNNLFADDGDLSPFNVANLPMQLGGNVFTKGTKPCASEIAPLLKQNSDPQIRLVEDNNGLQLHIKIDHEWVAQSNYKLVNSELLGSTAISKLPFENADGTPIRIDVDYLGNKRNSHKPFPGPFEEQKGGEKLIRIQTNAGLYCRQDRDSARLRGNVHLRLFVA
jgi:alpha-N-arabinofuranosidase